MVKPINEQLASKIEAILRKNPNSSSEEFRRSLEYTANTHPDDLDRFLDDFDDSWIEREQLHNAAEDGNLERVNELLQLKFPLNLFDTIGHTPLHYAVRGGHVHVIDRLIEAGADVNAHDESQIGDTALNEFANSCSYEVVKRLIDAGADPTIRGWMGLDGIYRASQRTDPDAQRVQSLLQEAAARFTKRG